MKMEPKIACLVFLAVCLAAVLGETVPCRGSCQGGPVTWDGQGYLHCCPAGHAIVVLYGKCTCHSPPPSSGSGSAPGSAPGSVPGSGSAPGSGSVPGSAPGSASGNGSASGAASGSGSAVVSGSATSSSSDGGSVMVATENFNVTEYNEGMQMMFEDLQQMARWIRTEMGHDVDPGVPVP
ncbi:hypothetical protein ACOMHN_059449 [Nucella lapillus]